MPQGLRVFDANTGAVTFDTNYRVSRTLGIVQPGLGSSVYTDDRLTTGTPWAFYVFEGSTFQFGDYDVAPQMTAPLITFSGNQMLITRKNPPPYGTANTVSVYYGVR